MKHTKLNHLLTFFILTLFLMPQAHAQSLYKKTPSDMEGPFYPIERQADEDNDLINIKGKSKPASGDVLNLTGVVFNENGDPQTNVTIEIWQTDTKGLYRHPRDRSNGQRDPFFQYWGRATTDQEGKYSFLTILPGEYEPRPPHIHFKVWVDGKVILTSQMYISRDRKKLRNVNDQLRLDVIKNNEGEYSGHFKIVY